MLVSLRHCLAGQLEILGSDPVQMICRKVLVQEKCRNEIELFSIGNDFFADHWKPLQKLQLHVQKRHKSEIPGTELIPEDGSAVDADPALILGDGKKALLCGFLDTDIHCGRFDVSSDGIRCIAEYHPAYRPETETVCSQKIVFISGKDPVELLKQYAALISANYHLSPQMRFPRYAVGANWHYYGPTMTEKQLDEELDSIISRRIPLDVYQLDDGWQKDYGDWEPNCKWPSGMKAAADRIKAAGMIPGIWITPFLCGKNSVSRFPEDWMLRDADGNRLTMMIGVIPFFIFDPSHPGVQEYIKSFLLTIKSWGYVYYKIDFTRCLFLNPAACPYDRSITLLQLYRRGIELLRNTLGEECCLNLCGGHEGATVGLADVTRTGRDTYGKWDKPEDAPWIRIRECVMRGWMNSFRMSDPDASIMRLNSQPLPEDADFTPHGFAENYANLSCGFLSDIEAETFVLNQFLGGGIAEIGERLPDLSGERLALLKKVVPPYGEAARPLDFFTYPMPQFYRTEISSPLPELESWTIISVLNITDETADLHYPEEFIAETMVYDLSEMKMIGIFAPGDSLLIAGVPAHGSKVLKFIRMPEKRQPFFVADDLHYSAGAVEIVSIKTEGNAICGQLKSPWHCRVRIAGAFPLPDGKSWQIVDGDCDSNGGFTLTLE